MGSDKIARAFVACSRWRWMPGMMTEGWRLTCVSLHDGAWSATSTLAHREYHYPTLPDITDPATLGCILQVVRDAHGVQWLTTVPLMTAGGVHGWLIRGLDTPVCKSEAEALLRALQAAPQYIQEI